MKTLWIMTWVLPLLAMASGCGGKSGPRLEAWEGGAWVARAVTAYEISGKRDGAATRVVAAFTLADGERLRLELEVVYDPTPEIGAGTWSAGGQTGTVTTESLKFLGGQGEGPSLGGRFRLEENGVPRYRVVLPLKPVGQREWR